MKRTSVSQCLFIYPGTENENKHHLSVKQVISERRRRKKISKRTRLCARIFSVIIIPVKSRFLNPVAQADTLNKIILIPHGKRNENEEINMSGGGTLLPRLPLCLSLLRLEPLLLPPLTVLFPIMLRTRWRGNVCVCVFYHGNTLIGHWEDH